MPLQDAITRYAQRVDEQLQQWLLQTTGPSPLLQEALGYSLLLGGKRMRPLLVYATGQALGAPLAACDRPAMAVELIHAYSLVHDDLPAMDDDDLRRGHPTCHKAFDEATAILVGDALQTLAFEVLADARQPAALQLVQSLAEASGSRGMVAGQMLDLQAEGRQLSLEQLEQLHNHKTGALIRAAVRMGALVSGADAATLQALDVYAAALGLAFQVQDDLLDVTGDAATLGKKTGADAQLNKATYPALLGVAGARSHAEALVERACASLEPLSGDWLLLQELARWSISRNH
ncbi:(2E,6E)-farnesyl diphosphate synthase [Marinospirillum alkaliphilum]|jgi:geranylgeranyl pyrophosphate synthase|uniref:Farnesyl-diphosphate synthase n=1 Tax=Marinospirillum alkaliphilum DSM 21637 TaxID=1122209 RepID=A0A1K1Z6A0_9GAMM|nr:farnesyl diphosphate synthase [Marinospirillum alkaliphilum]SFX69638.1 farnesyl-diphosphate synthase [Marinospirillum alkaliphilum DSM 21637]